MAQTVDAEIQKYLPLLAVEEKRSILAVIKSFMNLKKGSTVEEDITQYNKEIDEAEAEFKNGDFDTHEAFLEQVKKW